jgi:hypothetical protein
VIGGPHDAAARADNLQAVVLELFTRDATMTSPRAHQQWRRRVSHLFR